MIERSWWQHPSHLRKIEKARSFSFDMAIKKGSARIRRRAFFKNGLRLLVALGFLFVGLVLGFNVPPEAFFLALGVSAVTYLSIRVCL